MSTQWRYYNSKRGNGFRGRRRGRGRGSNLTAVSLPRDDCFHKGEQNEAYFKDKPMNPNDFRDETVLSVSFGQNLLGAAYYEQSSQLVKLMNDISEDLEFTFLKRLIEDVKPTMIIVNRSQDLDFIKFLSSRYTPHEKQPPDHKDTTEDTSEETIPTWDPQLAYSTDKTTTEEEKDEDDELCDEKPATLYKLPNNFFKMPRALQRLKMMVDPGDNTISEEDKHTIITMRFDIEAVNMIRSFGALLFFLDETRLGVEKDPLSISTPIKSIKTMTLENLVDIDHNTFQALEILPRDYESKACGQGRSLYSLLDRCRSTVGKKCLRKWFRNPTTDRQELFSRQKCVHYFKQDWNADVTSKIASLLGKVKALNNVFQKFQSGTAQLIHWECFVSTVNALVEIISIIRQTPISNVLVVETELLTEVSEIAVIAGSIINFAESKIQGRVTVMPGIDEDLDRLRDIYENMPMVLTAIAKQEAERLGLAAYCNVTCVYIPLVGFVLSLPRDFPAESHSDISLVYATSEELRVRNATTERLDDEFGDILMKLIDKQTAIILTLKAKVMKKKRIINKLLSIISRIDVLISFGLVAAENGWNCPTLIDEPVVEALELYHPISALVVKKNFVPNQVISGRNGIKASIITGPNACGKSVYMKSIGILVFLSQIGSFVPARHARIGMVDRIVTRMFTVDSVLDGMSTFAKDVEQVALALRKATEHSLVIIDEFGKGTMTEVGLSLLASCMTYWIKKGPDHCPHIFLSSHFHALPKYIPLNTKMVSFLTFTVLREPAGKIRYLFRLTPGMVDCSFAMTIAKEEGIPADVLGRACRIYKALKSGTPLKKIKADVSNENVRQLVKDMDIVLSDESGFLDVVESLVQTQKKTCPENFASNATLQKMSERDKESKSPFSVRKTISAEKRANSSISCMSMASLDQLSVFDALLPKKAKKTVRRQLENNYEQTEKGMQSSRSPDIFLESEGEEEMDSQEEGLASRTVFPIMQRLDSEEENEQLKSSSCGIKPTDEFGCIPIDKEQNKLCDIKGPALSRDSEMSRTTKISMLAASPTSLPQKSKAPEDSCPSSLNRSHESILSKKYSSMDKFSEKSGTLALKQNESHLGSNKSLNITNNSIFKSQEPNTSARPSSHPELMPDGVKSTQTSNNTSHSPFTPICSQFSIFDTLHSANLSSNMSMNDNETSRFLKFFGCDQTKSNDGCTIKSTESCISQNQMTRSKSDVSAKRRSLSQQQTKESRDLVSPSSAILGELAGVDGEQTPVPRGDKPISDYFEFDVTEDDPIYGRKNTNSSPKFDFLKSNDEDDAFLKSFLESDISLQIDTNPEKKIGR